MNAILPAEVQCPHCFELVIVQIDTTQGPHETIEDCEVCCRPMEIRAECRPGVLIDVCAGPA